MCETSRQGSPYLPLSGHGGDLFAARRLYPQAPQPWLDLSTGINPFSYPFADLPVESWTRLPQPEELAILEAAARVAYRAPETAEIIAAPGSQALINWLPRLVPARRVGILGFSYCEHVRSWERIGAGVTIAEDLAELENQDVAIIVNPNNPDGRLTPVTDLNSLSAALAERNGLLIVDEAFADFLRPGVSAVPDMPARGMLVLRSFGKGYGLPGVRLGFAISSNPLASMLRIALGPWPVSGAAIALGAKALMDGAWLAAARLKLEALGAALDELLAAAGFEPAGGSLLFRLVHHEEAQIWFERLAQSGILVRRFEARTDWLRFGIPPSEGALARVCAALGLETNRVRKSTSLKSF